MATRRKWKWWQKQLLLVLLSVYAAIVITPVRNLGVTDDAIASSAILAMGIPVAAYLAYALAFNIWKALSPAANDILNLAVRIWSIGRTLYRSKHGG